MRIPRLKKKLTKKKCHNIEWVDNYAWIHQENILDVLKDKKKLLTEVKNYLLEENTYTQKIMEDTKSIQKTLFKEIKGRIKLEDESLPFRDKKYDYWTKTTKKGNYFKKLRRKIGDEKIEIYWDGDLEAKGKKFFNTGDLIFGEFKVLKNLFAG